MKGNTRGEGRIHLFEKDGGQTPNKTKMGGVPSKTCDRGRGASRVSIRITFAQFLRNETQYFSFFAHQLCAKKKQQFSQSFAKVISRKIAIFRFYETQV